MREERAAGKRRFPGVLLILLIAVLLPAGLYIGSGYVPFTVEELSGAEGYDEELLIKKLFPEEKRNLRELVLVSLNGKEVPGVSSFSVSVTGLFTVRVSAVLKNETAFMKYEGELLVLSEDGALLRTAKETPEGLVLISGCGISGGTPFSMAEVQDPEALTGLLAYAAAVKLRSIPADSLQYRSGEYHLRIGDVDVNLGTAEYADGKAGVILSQYASYGNLKGILHLEKYDPDAENERYVFEVDTEAGDP